MTFIAETRYRGYLGHLKYLGPPLLPLSDVNVELLYVDRIVQFQSGRS